MFKKIALFQKLILGIILGIIIGYISKSADFLIPVRILSTFSGLFGNFLNFIIPFIIIGFVVVGIAELGSGSGKLLGITVLLAYISTMLSGLLAFAAGHFILPGILKAGELAPKASVNLNPFFTVEMPPVVGVMSALITSFILGLGISHLKGNSLMNVFREFQQIVELVVKKVLIPLIPIHICGIFSKLTANGEIFTTMKSFSIVFIMLLLLQVLHILFQYTLVWIASKKNPFKCIKNMLPAYLTAVGTQSSAATIPVTIRCALKNNVSEEIVDFVIPLGATIHLAGDTITIVLCSMAIMLMSGQVPTFSLIFPFIMMLGVTMVAAPGIPGGGVYASLGLLKDMLLFTQPQQGIMIALHLAQDSFGTATNITGDCAIAIMVDKISKLTKKEPITNQDKSISA